MSTGSFENWAGEIAEIGAIYPFEGTETLLWIVGIAFWLWWHYKQSTSESQQLSEEENKLQQDPEYLSSLLGEAPKE